jgi:Lysylphosphatidylglycerol synthase TM region
VKRTLQRVLPVAVTLGALAWLLRDVNLAAVGAALSPRVAWVFLPSLVVYGAATLWIEAASLSTLVHTREGLDLWTAARIKCASYLVTIVHYALGVGAVAVLLRRRNGLPLTRAASLVLLIATADLTVVLGLAAAGAARMGRGSPVLYATLVAVGLLGLVGGLALLRMPRSLGPLDRIRELSAFDALRGVPLSDLARLFALRIAMASCFVAICGAGFAAFRIAVPLPELVAGALIAALAGALPSVAGIGPSQAAFVYVFGSYAPAETLLATSLVISAGLVILRAGMGVAFAREFTREALRETREPAR